MRLTKAEIKIAEHMIENAKNATAIIYHTKFLEKTSLLINARMRCSHIEFGYGTGTKNVEDEQAVDSALLRIENAFLTTEEDYPNIFTIIVKWDDGVKIHIVKFHVDWNVKKKKLQSGEIIFIDLDTPSKQFKEKIEEWKAILKKELFDKRYDFSDARGAEVGRNLGISEGIKTEDTVIFLGKAYKVNATRYVNHRREAEIEDEEGHRRWVNINSLKSAEEFHERVFTSFTEWKLNESSEFRELREEILNKFKILTNRNWFAKMDEKSGKEKLSAIPYIIYTKFILREIVMAPTNKSESDREKQYNIGSQFDYTERALKKANIPYTILNNERQIGTGYDAMIIVKEEDAIKVLQRGEKIGSKLNIL